MRRTLTATVAGLALAATLLPATTATADDEALGLPPAAATLPDPAVPTDQQLLTRAAAALGGARPVPGRPEATLALRDLFAALPRLDVAERRRAEAILARPTQGAGDPHGDGYTAPSTRACSARVCVHRVRRTADRASAGWARTTLKVLNGVWRREVGRMGYRRPVDDGRRGGNGKLDVYLVDVGSDGLYGYCAPERTRTGFRRTASGYCVLDNDFARSQFGARPLDSLRVTAAHEFFHALQFGYDYLEDPWLMETTATWMEERFADRVDDNRQYLPFGQVAVPSQPLDLFSQFAANQYGNWAFVEYLSGRFGAGFVRRVWKQAGSYRGDGGKYSTKALVAALPRSAPFPRVYAAFQAANVLPARSYPEGRHWPRPQLGLDRTLGRHQGVGGPVRIDHLAGRVLRVRPGRTLDTRRWRLRVRVDGPGRRSSPRVTVVRQKAAGRLTRTPVSLDARGIGTTTMAFNRRQTRAVWVVLANASTRFDCRGAYRVGYSCGGRSRDDARRFGVRLSTFSRG